MKKITAFYTMFLLVLGSGFTHAQDFAKVDATVKKYPATFASADIFAAKVKADFTHEDEKARAIFTWIALNIHYDTSPSAKGRNPIKFSYSTPAERKAALTKIENELANSTLKLKKGVCHGYAMLFAVVAKKTGLDSEVIYGNAKSVVADIGKAPAKSNHAWNAVKVNGQWKLLDVTWGSGGMSGNSRMYDDKYFFTSPDLFFLNHFPDDKKWLMTAKTAIDFAALPLYYNLKYELVAPVGGTIKKSATGIPIKIKGLKATDDVVYQFTSAAYSKKASPKFTNGLAEFTVPVDISAKGNLTIFVNKVAVAAYKIAN